MHLQMRLFNILLKLIKSIEINKIIVLAIKILNISKDFFIYKKVHAINRILLKDIGICFFHNY